MAGVGTGGTITGVGEVLREKLGQASSSSPSSRRARRSWRGQARACTPSRASAPASCPACSTATSTTSSSPSRTKTRSRWRGGWQGRGPAGRHLGRRQRLGGDPGGEAARRGQARRDDAVRYGRAILADGGLKVRFVEESHDMPVTVYIPTPFRRLTGNQSYVEVGGRHRWRGAGQPRRSDSRLQAHDLRRQERDPGHINIYVNNKRSAPSQGKLTPVTDGDEVAVIPALAGGATIGARVRPDAERRPLLAAHHHAPGRQRRSAQDLRREGADRRRRRPRLAESRSTWRSPVSARSASSTSTSSTSRTCSARSCTRTTTSVSARCSRRARRSTPTTRT